MIDKRQKNYIKNFKAHRNQSRTVAILNAIINTTLLHRCSFTSEYSAKTRFSCIFISYEWTTIPMRMFYLVISIFLLSDHMPPTHHGDMCIRVYLLMSLITVFTWCAWRSIGHRQEIYFMPKTRLAKNKTLRLIPIFVLLTYASW